MKNAFQKPNKRLCSRNVVILNKSEISKSHDFLQFTWLVWFASNKIKKLHKIASKIENYSIDLGFGKST